MIDRVDIKFFKEVVTNIGKETDVDISGRCPICGDGSKRNSKRLHLYNKGTVTGVNCFNGDCEVHNKTMYSFLRDFFPSVLPRYKKETFSTRMNLLKDSRSQGTGNAENAENTEEVSLKSIGKKIKAEIAETIEPDTVKTLDLSPYMLNIHDSIQGSEYLRNRGIEPRNGWYYGTQDLKIKDTVYKITDSVIVPLYYKDKMYGFYSRSTKNKNFITYMDNENIGYKIWNFFYVDKSEPVYIFEGIFDAISSGLPNSIALLGAKLPDDRLKEFSKPVFVLDNDKTGTENMIDYAKQGYSCFVCPKNIKIKDMNEILLKTDINLPQLIKDNVFKGISALTRLKQKL